MPVRRQRGRAIDITTPLNVALIRSRAVELSITWLGAASASTESAPVTPLPGEPSRPF